MATALQRSTAKSAQKTARAVVGTMSSSALKLPVGTLSSSACPNTPPRCATAKIMMATSRSTRTFAKTAIRAPSTNATSAAPKGPANTQSSTAIHATTALSARKMTSALMENAPAAHKKSVPTATHAPRTMCATRPAAANFLRKQVHAMTVIHAPASDPTKNPLHPTPARQACASPAPPHTATTTTPARATSANWPAAAISKPSPTNQTADAPKTATPAPSSGASPASAATSNPQPLRPHGAQNQKAEPHLYRCRSAIFLLTNFQSRTPRVSELCFEGRLGGTVSSAFCVSKTDSAERQRGAPQERPDACPEKYNLLTNGAFLIGYIPLHRLPINSLRLNWRRAAQVIERLHTNLPCKEVNIVQILTANWC